MIKTEGLHTVCQEAACPNVGECWERGTATFMILGDTCTRRCGFCNVKTGKPTWNDPLEPARVARSVAKMGLRHAVITSVDRDDLPDYGASRLRRRHPPDPPAGARAARSRSSRPTSAARRCRSPRSSPSAPTSSTTTSRSSRGCIPSPAAARAGSARCASCATPRRWAATRSSTKSGLMVGLGETHDEMVEAFGALREHGVQVLTVGQYLRPTERHLPVVRFWHPDEFKALEDAAYALGFDHIAAGPLVRLELPRRPARAAVPARAAARSPPPPASAACVFPIKDNIPTDRFPVVTVDADRAQRDRVLLLAEGRAVVRRSQQPATTSTTWSATRRSRTSSRTRASSARRSSSDAFTCSAAFGARYDLPPTCVTVFTAMFMHGGLLHLGGNMLFLWIFGNNVEDSMGPVKFVALLPARRARGDRRRSCSSARTRRSRTSARRGRSPAVLGGYILLFPRARVVTIIFIVFFFTILELPALLILGFWFIQQALFGYFDLASGAGAGRRRRVLRPHRRLRVRADRDQAVRGRAQAAAAGGGRPVRR